MNVYIYRITYKDILNDGTYISNIHIHNELEFHLLRAKIAYLGIFGVIRVNETLPQCKNQSRETSLETYTMVTNIILT